MSSYIVLNSAKVRELCEKKIDAIEQARHKEIEEFIQERLVAANSRWWRRLFKLEVSRQYIEAIHATHLSEIRYIFYGWNYERARHLLQMAQCVGEMRLSVEDFTSISP